MPAITQDGKGLTVKGSKNKRKMNISMDLHVGEHSESAEDDISDEDVDIDMDHNEESDDDNNEIIVESKEKSVHFADSGATGTFDDLTYDLYNLTACDYHPIRTSEDSISEEDLQLEAERVTQYLFKR